MRSSIRYRTVIEKYMSRHGGLVDRRARGLLVLGNLAFVLFITAPLCFYVGVGLGIGVSIGVIGGSFAHYERRIARVRRHLASHPRCLQCDYDLSGAPRSDDERPCPECGTPYSAWTYATIADLW